MLKTHPFCACSFNLSQIADWEGLPQRLTETIERGLASYRRALMMLRQTLIPMLDQFADSVKDPQFAGVAANLVKVLQDGKGLSKFSNIELAVFQKIFAALDTVPLVDLDMPESVEYMGADELRQKVNRWVDELPGYPVLVKL